MASLYNIADNILNLLTMFEDEDCPVSDECIADTFEGLEGELTDKVNSWCRTIKTLQSDEKALGDEIKRLQGKKKSAEKAQVRMKAALCRVLKGLGYDKFKTAEYSLYSFKDNKLVYTDTVPDEWKVEKTTKTVSDAVIREALERGEDLDFARFTESLTVR